MKSFKKFITEEMELSILIVVTFLVLTITGMKFGNSIYSHKNVQSMAFQIPEFGFLCLAMMLSNMIGGIDLSIIANANTVAIFTALILNGTCAFGTTGSFRIILAVAVAIIVSLGFGLLNGFIVAKTSAPPLIATLGTMTFISGIGMALTGGKSIRGIDPKFAAFGKSVVFGLPLIFWLFIIATMIIGFTMNYTEFGRKFMLLGSNPVASRFSGIDNDKINMIVFMITGLLGGLAGLIILSRVNSAKVGYGESYLLQTMIVCVIGGISPNGGKGKVSGVLLAVLLMQVMSSSFTIMSLSPYTKKLIWGVMLILVLGLNHTINLYSKKRNLRQSINGVNNENILKENKSTGKEKHYELQKSV